MKNKIQLLGSYNGNNNVYSDIKFSLTIDSKIVNFSLFNMDNLFNNEVPILDELGQKVLNNVLNLDINIDECLLAEITEHLLKFIKHQHTDLILNNQTEPEAVGASDSISEGSVQLTYTETFDKTQFYDLQRSSFVAKESSLLKPVSQQLDNLNKVIKFFKDLSLESGNKESNPILFHKFKNIELINGNQDGFPSSLKKDALLHRQLGIHISDDQKLEIIDLIGGLTNDTIECFSTLNEYSDYLKKNYLEGISIIFGSDEAGSSDGYKINVLKFENNSKTGPDENIFYLKQLDSRSVFPSNNLAIEKVIESLKSIDKLRGVYKLSISQRPKGSVKKTGRFVPRNTFPVITFYDKEGEIAFEKKEAIGQNDTHKLLRLKKAIIHLNSYNRYGVESKEGDSLFIPIADGNIIEVALGKGEQDILSFSAFSENDDVKTPIPLTDDMLTNMLLRFTTIDKSNYEKQEKNLLNANRLLLLDEMYNILMPSGERIKSCIAKIGDILFYTSRDLTFSNEFNVISGYAGQETRAKTTKSQKISTSINTLRFPEHDYVSGFMSNIILGALLGNNDLNDRNLGIITKNSPTCDKNLEMINLDKKTGLGMLFSDPNADFFLEFDDSLIKVLGSSGDSLSKEPSVAIINIVKPGPERHNNPYLFETKFVYSSANINELFTFIYNLERLTHSKQSLKELKEIEELFTKYLPKECKDIFYQRLLERTDKLVAAAKDHLKDLPLYQNGKFLDKQICYSEYAALRDKGVEYQTAFETSATSTIEIQIINGNVRVSSNNLFLTGWLSKVNVRKSDDGTLSFEHKSLINRFPGGRVSNLIRHPNKANFYIENTKALPNTKLDGPTGEAVDPKCKLFI